MTLKLQLRNKQPLSLEIDGVVVVANDLMVLCSKPNIIQQLITRYGFRAWEHVNNHAVIIDTPFEYQRIPHTAWFSVTNL